MGSGSEVGALQGICGLWLQVVGAGRRFGSCNEAFCLCLMAFLNPSEDGQEGEAQESVLTLFCLPAHLEWSD